LNNIVEPESGVTILLTTVNNVGSKTLFNPVFINHCNNLIVSSRTLQKNTQPATMLLKTGLTNIINNGRNNMAAKYCSSLFSLTFLHDDATLYIVLHVIRATYKK
jgi:hypothetical protein